MLSDADRAILDLERRTFQQPGAKEQAILDATGLTAPVYYFRLGRLIDTLEAVEYDPVTVNRLRRLRSLRARRRAA